MTAKELRFDYGDVTNVETFGCPLTNLFAESPTHILQSSQSPAQGNKRMSAVGLLRDLDNYYNAVGSAS
jgi:hypothetical protein